MRFFLLYYTNHQVYLVTPAFRYHHGSNTQYEQNYTQYLMWLGYGNILWTPKSLDFLDDLRAS